MEALLIILVILIVIALLPIGIDGGYRDSTLELNVKSGPIMVRVLPRRKKVLKPEKLKRKEEINETEKEKKHFDKQQVIGIIKAGLKTLARLKRKISIDYLRIHCIVASDDPAYTAIGYGMGSAVMGTIVSLAEEALDIKERDFGFSFDFLAEKPVIDIWLTATLQVWEIIYIAAAFGIDFLKLKRQKKRRTRVKERNELNG